MKPLLIFAMILLAACGAGSEPGAAPPREAAAVAPQTAEAVLSQNAPLATVPAIVTLPPAARVAVTAPFAGAVSRVHVIEGEQVRAGQLLATVISRDALSLASDRARAASRLKLAEAQAARMGQLAREGVVAGARQDEADAALSQARVDVAEAGRILARGGASADGVVRLVAPMSGRVSRVAVETGGPLDGMTAPFVIETSDRYSLTLQLPQRLAPSVRPGMAVEGPNGLRGRIVSVSPGIDLETRSVMARATIATGAGLIAGQSLGVTIIGSGAAGAVTIPAVALTRLEGRDVVFVQTPKGFAPRDVAPGAVAGGSATILTGLKAGERVAISNLPELKVQAGQ